MPNNTKWPIAEKREKPSKQNSSSPMKRFKNPEKLTARFKQQALQQTNQMCRSTQDLGNSIQNQNPIKRKTWSNQFFKENSNQYSQNKASNCS